MFYFADSNQALRTLIDALKSNLPVTTRIIFLSSALSPATEGGSIGCLFSCMRCCLRPVLGNVLVDNDQCTWLLGAQTHVPFTIVRMVRPACALNARICAVTDSCYATIIVRRAPLPRNRAPANSWPSTRLRAATSAHSPTWAHCSSSWPLIRRTRSGTKL